VHPTPSRAGGQAAAGKWECIENEALGWHSARVNWRVALLGVAIFAAACGSAERSGLTGTVALGDNFVAPDLQLNDDFFYCRIQPEVFTQHGCATGGPGEGGRCHDSRSALRLLATQDPPPCDGSGKVVRSVPDAYAKNLTAARFFVQGDALGSPLYLCPTAKASHPRRIFDDQDNAAKLILQWIASGAN
jgi:hypothetical protein